MLQDDRVNAQFHSPQHARSAIELLRLADQTLQVQTSNNESVRPATGNPGSPTRTLTFRANVRVLSPADVEGIVRRRLRYLFGDSNDLKDVRRIEYGGEERFFVDFVAVGAAVRVLETLRRTTSLVVEYSKEDDEYSEGRQQGGMVGAPQSTAQLGLGAPVTDPSPVLLQAATTTDHLAQMLMAAAPQQQQQGVQAWNRSPTTATMSTGTGGGNSPTDAQPGVVVGQQHTHTSSGGSANTTNQGIANNQLGLTTGGNNSPRGSHGSRHSDREEGSPGDRDHRDYRRRDRNARDRPWRDSNRSRSRSPGLGRGAVGRRSRSTSRERDVTRRYARVAPVPATVQGPVVTLGGVPLVDA
ncbi:hypothetical protein HDU93_002836, partial [Gonapodya sp. JEL0774]